MNLARPLEVVQTQATLAEICVGTNYHMGGGKDTFFKCSNLRKTIFKIWFYSFLFQQDTLEFIAKWILASAPLIHASTAASDRYVQRLQVPPSSGILRKEVPHQYWRLRPRSLSERRRMSGFRRRNRLLIIMEIASIGLTFSPANVILDTTAYSVRLRSTIANPCSYGGHREDLIGGYQCRW